MATKVVEERTVYLPSRRREVRCRLWYEVTPWRDGLARYFLMGIEELEEGIQFVVAAPEASKALEGRIGSSHC